MFIEDQRTIWDLLVEVFRTPADRHWRAMLHVCRAGVPVLMAMLCSCATLGASPEWESISRNHTVRVERLSLTAQSTGLGWGVTILDRVIAVPLHCIEGYADVVVVTQGGAVCPIQGMISFDPTIDLALVYVPTLPLAPVQERANWDDLRHNQDVIVPPSPNGEFSQAHGKVTEPCRIWMGKISTTVSIGLQPGSSGRAVFTMNGKFVGFLEAGTGTSCSVSPVVLWNAQLEHARARPPAEAPKPTPLVHDTLAAYRLWQLGAEVTEKDLATLLDLEGSRRLVKVLRGGGALQMIASALNKTQATDPAQYLTQLKDSVADESQYYLFLGNAQLSSGNRVAAEQAFDLVTNKNYKIMALSAVVGVHFSSLRLEATARNALDQLAAIAPDIPAVWELHIRVAQKYREPSMGVRACLALGELQPSAAEHWFRLGCFAISANDARALAAAHAGLATLDSAWRNRLKFIESQPRQSDAPSPFPISEVQKGSP